MTTALCKAFPDWSFHASDYRESGDSCTCRFEITGPHKADLVLPFPGVAPVRATGLTIRMPPERAEFAAKNGKIRALDSKVGPDGGVLGMLDQLCVSLPSQASTSAGRPRCLRIPDSAP